MREIESPSGQNEVPILPWPLVGGIFLHFVVPAYLVSVVVDALLSAPRGATIEAMLHRALPFSGWFLAIYFLVASSATAGAAAIDPILRARRARRAASALPAGLRMSETGLASALSRGRGRFGAEADARLSAIQAKRWDHSDHRFQMLSNDLQDVVTTSLAALIDATPDRRPILIRMTCDSLTRIEAALDDLAMESRRRADGDVEAVYRYIQARHGGSDFAGSTD